MLFVAWVSSQTEMHLVLHPISNFKVVDNLYCTHFMKIYWNSSFSAIKRSIWIVYTKSLSESTQRLAHLFFLNIFANLRFLWVLFKRSMVTIIYRKFIFILPFIFNYWYETIIRKYCMHKFDFQFSLNSQSQLRMSHDRFYSRHLMVNFV